MLSKTLLYIPFFLSCDSLRKENTLLENHCLMVLNNLEEQQQQQQDQTSSPLRNHTCPMDESAREAQSISSSFSKNLDSPTLLDTAAAISYASSHEDARPDQELLKIKTSELPDTSRVKQSPLPAAFHYDAANELEEKGKEDAREFVEPLLDESLGQSRLQLYPIQDQEIFDLYKTAVSMFWTPNEIDLSNDIRDWDQVLTDEERHFLKYVLAFFATSDAVVNENLTKNFSTEVMLQEARMFYAFQTAIEAIHTEMYSNLITTYIRDIKEQNYLFEAAKTLPCVEEKVAWAERWMNTETAPYCERIIAFACLEGVFFSGSFCAIYWIKSRGLLPGLCRSNELISKDESLHCLFAATLHRRLLRPASRERVLEILLDAVRIEKNFIQNAIPEQLIGMNADLMGQYIEYCADLLLCNLHMDIHFHTSNPFDFVNLATAQGKSNFFECLPTEYKRAVMFNSKPLKTDFEIDDDF